MNKLQIKLGDFVEFETNDRIYKGFIYHIENNKYYISEGRNVGGAQMWVIEDKEIITKMDYDIYYNSKFKNKYD